MRARIALVFLISLFCLATNGSAIAGAGFTDPAKSHQIVFGMGWEPVGFFPIRAIDSGSYYAQTLVYEGLVKYDAHINIVPALAQEYTISGGGLRYEFRLRKDLHFSDGTAITLTDVETSFKLAIGPDSPFKSDYSDIASFQSVEPDKFVIHLSHANAALLSRLVELRVLPSKLTTLPDRGRSILSRSPISSGPFCLKKWESGLELVFVPNQYYWGEKPHVERLIWRVVPDKTLLALCLSRGEVDIAQLDANGWKAIANNSGLLLERFAGSRTMYLGFNLAREPFDQLPLREIVCRAINRRSIIDHLLDGLARLPTSDVPSGSWAFNERLQPCPFDPEAARKQLAEFERSTPFKEVSFRILAVREHQDIAEAIAYDLEKIGLKNEVQIMEFSTLRRAYLQPGKFDVVLWSRSSGPDPECGMVWGSHGPLNFCRFSNSEVDQLLTRGRGEMDREGRAAIYKEIQRILAKELPWIFLCQPDLLLAHARHCRNIRLENQSKTGLPWDNPLFNAASWERE